MVKKERKIKTKKKTKTKTKTKTINNTVSQESANARQIGIYFG
jgi:hypothetical protein